MSIALVIVGLFGFLIAAGSMLLLFRGLRGLPEASGRPGPRVSIIVPARNEEVNLSKLLGSLEKQSLKPIEIIVVDDQSDDGTADVARSHGAKVLAGRPLPDGWFGKPWACQQGADVALGDVLLFLDADLEFDADGLARLAAAAEEIPESVLSVCPWHRTERPYEQLSVFFNLLMVGGIGAFTWKRGQAEGIGLFGQTLWVSKALYQNVEGHHKVRRAILENFQLSREFAQMGVGRECFVGRGCISMRMFPNGLGELISSWSKGFSSGMGLTSPLALLLSSFWLSGLMILTVNLCLSPFGDSFSASVLLVLHLMMAGLLAVFFRRVGDFSIWNALLFPVSLVFYQVLFGVSVIRKRRGGTVKWKGRDVA